MTDKQLALKTLGQLPESASLAEITYELETVAAIRQGQEDELAGRVRSHAEVEQLLNNKPASQSSEPPVATESSSRRGPAKKLTRKLKKTGTGKTTKPLGEAHLRMPAPAPVSVDESRPLSMADLWDEEDAAFFQPYFDKLAAGGL